MSYCTVEIFIQVYTMNHWSFEELNICRETLQNPQNLSTLISFRLFSNGVTLQFVPKIPVLSTIVEFVAYKFLLLLSSFQTYYWVRIVVKLGFLLNQRKLFNVFMFKMFTFVHQYNVLGFYWFIGLLSY